MLRINKKVLELYVLPAVLVVLLFVPHLLSFDNSYVDVEPIYVQSASEIAEHGLDANLSRYFTELANPVFTSFILAASYKLFGESPVVSRLTIFLLSFLFSLFLYFYLRKKEGIFGAFVLTLLVIVNPLFVIFSQFTYSDVPFMIFSSVSLVLLLYTGSSKGKLLSSIMLGISLATKYITIILFPVALIYSFVHSRIFSTFSRTRLLSLVRFDLWYFALSLLVSAPVISITFLFLGGIVSPQHESVIVLNAGMYIPRLFAYLMWFGLFIGPFFLIYLFDLWKRIGKKKLFILLVCMVVLTLIVTYFFPISSLHIYEGYFGETNLCGLEDIVPEPYLSVALFFAILMAEILIAGIVFDLMHTRDEKIMNLFFWIIVPIILMSLTRAAQRYMLVVLVPLSIYMSLVTRRTYSEHTKSFVLAVLLLHALIFLAAGFYSVY